MKKDMMYIFFFIFVLLALSVWNSGYLGLFGITAKPVGQNTPSHPVPNRRQRTARRTRRRETDSDSDSQYYGYLGHTLTIGDNNNAILSVRTNTV